jgi:hypothetical protein
MKLAPVWPGLGGHRADRKRQLFRSAILRFAFSDRLPLHMERCISHTALERSM